jgi:hypothetical protein
VSKSVFFAARFDDDLVIGLARSWFAKSGWQSHAHVLSNKAAGISRLSQSRKDSGASMNLDCGVIARFPGRS